MNLKRINQVKNALLNFKSETGTPIYHYFNSNPKGDYVTWSEDMYGEILGGDGGLKGISIQGTIDYFTKRENNGADMLENAIVAAGIPIIGMMVLYEDDTGYIHYTWTWEVV